MPVTQFTPIHYFPHCPPNPGTFSVDCRGILITCSYIIHMGTFFLAYERRHNLLNKKNFEVRQGCMKTEHSNFFSQLIANSCS